MGKLNLLRPSSTERTISISLSTRAAETAVAAAALDGLIDDSMTDHSELAPVPC